MVDDQPICWVCGRPINDEIFSFNGTRFTDPRTGKMIAITAPNELALLQTLWPEMGRCVEYEKIGHALWGYSDDWPLNFKNIIHITKHRLKEDLAYLGYKIKAHRGIGLEMSFMENAE